MHILLISNYYEPDGGAAATRLTRLAQHLKERGHSITVLSSLPHYPMGRIAEEYRGRFIGTDNRNGIHLIQTWLWATPNPKIGYKLLSQISFAMSAFIRGIFISKPDIILIEAQPMMAGLMGGILASIRGVPFVLNISDLWPDHLLAVGAISEDHIFYKIARSMVNRLYRKAALITVMSPVWGQKIATQIGESDKIRVIYNGVDLDSFSPDVDDRAFRDEYELGDKKIVSFIGTFATQYDFDTLLQVAENLGEGGDVIFLIVGQGSQEAYISSRLSEKNLHHVKRLPWLESAQLPAAWKASYATLWAMHGQALFGGTIPAKLYEAFASGTPVLAATEGISRDIIQQSGGGIAVPTGDEPALSDAVHHLLEHPGARQTMSLAARRYAEKNYDPIEVARQYENALQSVL